MKARVNIGDCYRDSAVPWSQWRVERIYRNHIGLPHAVVSSLQDPFVSRTIACPILVDRRRFQLIADAPAPQAIRAPRFMRRPPVTRPPVTRPVDAVVEVAI